MNKKGFTLIEALAAIIIGIIMIIAVPAVSKYILKSDRAVYVSDVSAYVETVRGKYEMKEYGPLLQDDEIMIVPIKSVILEKGTDESPYGKYEPEKSYVIIVPERNKYDFYATVIDETNTGMIEVNSNSLDEKVIKEDIVEEVPMLSMFETAGAIYEINGKAYKRIETREIEGEDVNQDEDIKAYVFKDITVEEDDGTKIVYTITLDNKGATTPGTTTIYELYTVGWYSDIGVTNRIRKITAPFKNGYEFLGYFTGEDGRGTQVITLTGLVIEGTERTFKNHGTLYAKWKECRDGYYSHDSLTCTQCPEGYRDGTNVENKIAESACLKKVGAGKYVKTAKDKNVSTCAANTFKNAHTVTYGQTSTCPACTTLGSGYTKSPGGTKDTGCYMTLTDGQYVKNIYDKTASSCPADNYSLAKTVNYGQKSLCTPCTNLGMYYTSSAGGTGPTGCYMTVAAGKYKTSATGIATSNCANDYYSENHTSNYGSTDNSCTICPEGYRNKGAAAEGIAKCLMTISAGKRVTTAGGSQTGCQNGAYSDQRSIGYGQTSNCTTCPAGYQNGSGAEGINNCVMTISAGNRVTTANGAQSNCAANTYSSQRDIKYGKTSGCTNCPSGYSVAAGSGTSKGSCKITCSANTRVATADSTCSSCGSGKTISSHTVSAGNTSSNCTDCSNKENVNSWGSGCNIASCKTGYTISDNTCVPCDNIAGAASYGDGCTVTSCSVGYYLSNNTCVRCSIENIRPKGTCTNGVREAEISYYYYQENHSQPHQVQTGPSRVDCGTETVTVTCGGSGSTHSYYWDWHNNHSTINYCKYACPTNCSNRGKAYWTCTHGANRISQPDGPYLEDDFYCWCSD